MSDISRDRLDADEDRLPWLEAVEDEDDEPGVGAGKLIAALIAGLIALGLVVGGIFWMRDRGDAGGAPGDGELIAAPEGNYKEAPSAPGGMEVEGTGDVAYPASEGADVNSTIDLTAIPEAPVTEPHAPAVIEPVPAAASVKTVALPKSTAAVAAVKAPVVPKPAPARPAPALVAAPVETAPAGTGTIQLGAFSSEAKANAAWKSLSGRFSFLGGLSSSVTPVSAGGSTLYRLRSGAGADAKGVCAKLKVAGESCVVVN
jgi:cell division septation protein DedD